MSMFLSINILLAVHNYIPQQMKNTNLLPASLVPLLLMLFLLSPSLSFSSQACTADSPEFLITFHPHLDAFWLNIDTELKDINFRPAGFLYNMNQRNSKTILNSMLQSLSSDLKRKYFVNEAVFFKDWYDYLSAQAKQKVKDLMKQGQLEVANGGWVENDQAVCYYDDILDQYTLGMGFFYREMGYQIKIGWATDSFGHSHSQVALQHLLGIEFQGIERVDDRYVNLHNQQPLLEFYWIPISDSNNKTYGGVLNHVRHFLHEVNNYRGMRTSTIKQDFAQIEKAMQAKYKKNKLFRFLGNDFQEFITEEFATLQSAMNQLNAQRKKTQCPAFKYGNPSDYLGLITKYYDHNTLKTRKFDFIPNWDQDRYWTGYYTTDPQLKKACKDFSRLINFYRKSLMHLQKPSQNLQKLLPAEQLLAVMQHHDGITATSKTYIEDEFRRRMSQKSSILLQSLTQLHGLSSQKQIVCKFYENNNNCEIKESEIGGAEVRQLVIITHGGSKRETIELCLPKGYFLDVEEVEEDIFCDNNGCRLVFQANLHPGVNKFRINSRTKDQMATSIVEFESPNGMSFSGRDFTISVQQNNKNTIKYQYGDGQYFTFGLYSSPNQGSSRQTMSWDKYGRRTDKTQYVVPGMYIMSNNGQLYPLTQFSSFQIAQGKLFKRIIAKSPTSQLIITIKNDEPNILSLSHKFKPQERAMNDYFLRVSSPVKSDTLFHDSNGFLVSKRILNSRPDYQYKPKNQDLINGNTYPACSFAYLINGDKKMMFFSDRAQGVASYQQDLLINFDRLAMDDGKGVGENYMKSVENVFRYKFAMISAQDDTERVWQRQYDEGLIGYLIKSESNLAVYKANPSDQISHVPGIGPQTRLKYSIFYLNDNEFVLRLQNLAQFQNLIVNKYTGKTGSYSWNIQQIGLKLKFHDIRDSYANGIARQQKLKWRKHWSNNTTQINLINQNISLNQNQIKLQPLQIRSFRINTGFKIEQKMPINSNFNANQHNEANILKEINDPKPLESRGFRKRCF